MNPAFVAREIAIRPVSTHCSGGSTRIAPTSFSQQSLWVLGQVLPQGSVYNESDVFRLRGALDVEALEASINEIVRRHEVLRTRFAVEDGEPVQVIVRELTVPLQVTDLSALPDGEREAEAQRLARDEVWAKAPKPKVNVEPPKDIPNVADLLRRTRLLFDLAHLALQTDSTRLLDPTASMTSRKTSRSLM